MQEFYNDVKSGNIFRRRICSRCGAVGYERLKALVDKDWESYPKYENEGFGVVVFTTWYGSMGRREFVLCSKCTDTLNGMLDSFMGKECE